MELNVELSAASWYKRELQLVDGDHVRIFVRLGGCGSVQPGFSLGVTKEQPLNAGLLHSVEGVVFYMEQENLWFLDGKSLHVRFDEVTEEIEFDVV